MALRIAKKPAEEADTHTNSVPIITTVLISWCRLEAPVQEDPMSSPPPEAAQGSSYTFRLSDLPKLDLQVDRGTDFTAWHLQWRSYCNLSGLAGQEASKKVEALSLCFSRETLSIVQNLGLTTK